MEDIRANYDEMFEHCTQTAAGFIHDVDPRNTFDVPEKERYEFWERLYASPGFGIWQGNFKDILTNPEANKAISDFIADKIRGRVHDPAVAEKLIPKDHGFGTKRVPLETRYFESYNQENVELVDISETPIVRITENGVLTSEKEFEFDFIIYATGFDAIFGSYNRIDIRGDQAGARLKEQWEEELATFLGIQTNGYPNMFMIIGPHAMAGNNPRAIEYQVNWVTELISHMNDNATSPAPRPVQDAQRGWREYVVEQGKDLLRNDVDSWQTGINMNLEGRQKRIVGMYSGGQPSYRRRCEEVARGGYKELNLK